MSFTPEMLTALPGFFRVPFLLRAAQRTHKRELLEAGKRIGLGREFFARSLGNVLDDFYGFLCAYYKCEYVYKNVIADRLFLARHSSAGAALHSEFRCGESRADVAIFNGTSTAYEIKTEYDSLGKLPSQIADYRRVFERIYVVSCKRHEAALLSLLDEDIGLLVYQRDYRIKTVREAAGSRSSLSLSSIFDCLHQSEYLEILHQELGYVPDCANSEVFAHAKARFANLPVSLAHDGFVRCLRRRGRFSEKTDIVTNLPRSLRYLGLSLKEGKGYMEKAVMALNAPAL